MPYENIAIAFSGGADSTTLLYDALDRLGPDRVFPVYFSYGQRHGPGERKAVAAITQQLGIEYKVIEVDLAQFGRSPLTDPNIKMPAQTENNQAITVVPFRNTMFLVMLAGYATINKIDSIALAPTMEDLPEYPDCRPEFFEAMQRALRLADRHYHLAIEVPYATMWKKEIIKIGMQLEVPYDLTHTCYEGRFKDPCKVCDACKEREASFVANGIFDPLLGKAS